MTPEMPVSWTGLSLGSLFHCRCSLQLIEFKSFTVTHKNVGGRLCKFSGQTHSSNKGTANLPCSRIYLLKRNARAKPNHCMIKEALKWYNDMN